MIDENEVLDWLKLNAKKIKKAVYAVGMALLIFFVLDCSVRYITRPTINGQDIVEVTIVGNNPQNATYMLLDWNGRRFWYDRGHLGTLNDKIKIPLADAERRLKETYGNEVK